MMYPIQVYEWRKDDENCYEDEQTEIASNDAWGAMTLYITIIMFECSGE